jgi:hypothetical protein
MSKRSMVLAALAAVTLVSVAQAGGRARVEVSQAPKQVKAGEAFELAITVVPEGWTHSRNIEPVVTASCGEARVVTSAVALKRSNGYRASLKLPAAGTWTIRVDSRYCHTVMSPLTVTALAAGPQKSSKTPS